MSGNPEYGFYVPNNIDPHKLTRGFLLTVILYHIIIQLIAHVDKDLYKNLYGTSKIQLCQKSYEKWNNYVVEIDPNLLNNIKNYSAIER